MMLNLFAAVLLAATAVEVDVKPLSGPPVSGELVELSSEQIVVLVEGAEKTFTSQQLASVSPKAKADPPAPPKVWVRLIDGSQLRAQSYRVSGGKAEIQLTVGGSLQLPTRVIQSVRLNAASQSDEVRTQWESLRASKSAGDLVVARKTPKSLDQLEGILGDIDDQTVSFRFDGDPLEVPRSRLEGIVYYHPAGSELSEPVCQLVTADGSQWSVARLWRQEAQLRGQSVAGVEFALPLQQLGKLDYSSGNVLYLSDMQPEAVQWTPYVESQLPANRLFKMFEPRFDESFRGEPLMLGGQSYGKGLAVHSRTSMVYRLPEQFRSFRAVVGIDDRLHSGGNVRLVISGDGKTLYEETVTGADEPRTLDLDIQGVRRLQLLVDFGEQLDVADHLNLCEARVTK